MDKIFDSMVEYLAQGERIEIRGFGSFEVRNYKSYEGRNPRTGAPVKVAPKRLPFFKVGKELRERVNSAYLRQLGQVAPSSAPTAAPSPSPAPAPSLAPAPTAAPTTPSPTGGLPPGSSSDNT